MACLDAPAGEMINIGSGIETSIAALAQGVLAAFGHSCQIALDKTKPDGQPRKVLNITKAHALLQWQAKITLTQGLLKTAIWYEEQ